MCMHREVVRRKAVMCLHRFQQKAPGLRDQLKPLIYTALCDKHPSVMWAALYVYQDFVKVTLQLAIIEKGLQLFLV